MITHKNSMTPLAKRRKAVAEAVRRASLVSVCGKTWQEQFELTLGLAGYQITRMSAFKIHELRQRAAEDGSALQAAGTPPNH